MFQISDLQNEQNMSTEEIEDLLNEDEVSLAERQMERAEEIRDERREDGISD